ncbi:MAG: hypothetical protein EOQ82_24870 [Mesorhizobium sp.]|uniref:hypothetical protein n=1 Tax=Mesorhizobium sp. TaxID=1871066 RepID=UPI000FE45BFF|nr:hypothetical protein [Mesorhizobium sp.]RWH52865.1 MAG: hypothetical protein EOQ82_24870 [Mesorhizobium sp.]
MESIAWPLAALVGALGGAIPDLLKAIRLRFKGRPAYMGTLWYWGMLLALMAVGALVAVWRSPVDIWEALAFGIAAPAFLTRLIASDKEDDLSDKSVSAWERMRRWWS